MMLRAAVLAGVVCAAHALTIKVEPRTEECFVEKVEQRQTPMRFIFQVTHGGQLDVDVNIYDPAGGRIQQLQAVADGRHDWIATAKGDYKVCFSNMMARWTPKWVSFYYTQGHSQDTAKVEHLDPIEKAVISLSEGLSNLQEEQKHLRAVERLHRETIETTNDRILWWSCCEAVVLVAMGLSQIYYLKRFLERKSSI
eukprot:TRINITY_DN18531_c0_g1_i1.p1 TRINITY_DN18531_c0_g1~~TRINITY_DN18531_c0_g1_i1.p1  ORF type:complete len:210 (+),score=100.40 TRINITY_DN18531_c0_g1_i1:40-630(+)